MSILEKRLLRHRSTCSEISVSDSISKAEFETYLNDLYQFRPRNLLKKKFPIVGENANSYSLFCDNVREKNLSKAPFSDIKVILRSGIERLHAIMLTKYELLHDEIVQNINGDNEINFSDMEFEEFQILQHLIYISHDTNPFLKENNALIALEIFWNYNLTFAADTVCRFINKKLGSFELFSLFELNEKIQNSLK